MFKAITLTALAALGATTMVPAAAEARPRYDRGYSQGYYGDQGGYYGNQYAYRDGRGNRGYDRGYGRGYRGDRGYRGGGRCRDKGTGGTIIGAIAGGLLGHEIADRRRGRGDGTTGAILGAGVGALAGRAIDRDC